MSRAARSGSSSTAPADLPPLDVDVGARRPGPREPRRQRPQVRAGRQPDRGRCRGRRRRGSPSTVDDEGVGVPEAERALVTEPFHRAWNVRESRIPGTGPRACSSAGGSSRRTAAGSIVARSARTAAPGPRRPLHARRWRRPSRRGDAMAETILIVEDEPEFAALVELWMARAGYRTVDAADRPGRPAPVLRRAPRPRHPRRRPAGPRRLAAHRADPRVQPRADPHGHGARLGGGQDPRPEARRRRLHHQAPVVPGAVGAGRGGPAPGRDGRARSGRAGCSTASSSSTSTTTAPTCAARRSRLTPTEFRLLAYLVEHAGQLVTHRQVLGAVWGAGYDRDVHLLRMTIRNLRLKLDAAAPGRGVHRDRVRPRLPADGTPPRDRR